MENSYYLFKNILIKISLKGIWELCFQLFRKSEIMSKIIFSTQLEHDQSKKKNTKCWQGYSVILQSTGGINQYNPFGKVFKSGRQWTMVLESNLAITSFCIAQELRMVLTGWQTMWLTKSKIITIGPLHSLPTLVLELNVSISYDTIIPLLGM